MKMYQISDGLAKHLIIDNLAEALQDIEIDLQEAEIGETITITLIEMTQDEFDNLPEMFEKLSADVKVQGE